LTVLRSFACDQFTFIPKELGQLTSLQELGQLTSLQELGFYGNQLTSVPKELGFYGNQLTSVPKELGQLTSLLKYPDFLSFSVDFTPFTFCW